MKEGAEERDMTLGEQLGISIEDSVEFRNTVRQFQEENNG